MEFQSRIDLEKNLNYIQSIEPSGINRKYHQLLHHSLHYTNVKLKFLHVLAKTCLTFCWKKKFKMQPNSVIIKILYKKKTMNILFVFSNLFNFLIKPKLTKIWMNQYDKKWLICIIAWHGIFACLKLYKENVMWFIFYMEKIDEIIVVLFSYTWFIC